ncbi:DUF397 domain-containing protein [Streptomyces montanisoli]|uniref:DUF397 domain-containing protein n=1 Tax=Streptomyces montanisoli TaxID=2798581 RepID=A0A940RWI4_9ACTN|nr:DUF397 domain-containing protein [Streptomyces montanisoli]MBP0459490.1 DUF397 domain-containing protein [Streptomyces montanisoli]
MSTKQSGVPQLHWFKSSYSGGEGGDCVEVGQAASAVHVRDSKDTKLGSFVVAPTTWAAFLDLARQG